MQGGIVMRCYKGVGSEMSEAGHRTTLVKAPKFTYAPIRIVLCGGSS